MSGKASDKTYAPTEVLEVFGKKLRVLDLGHELSDDIPVYPGHMKVATWWHLTHDESRMRMGDTDFWGYGVRGMSLCEHVSTHVDAIFHFNPTRPDLTVDTIPLSTMITPAAWVDLSTVESRTDISLDQLRRARRGRDRRRARVNTPLLHGGGIVLGQRAEDIPHRLPRDGRRGIPLVTRPGNREPVHRRYSRRTTPRTWTIPITGPTGNDSWFTRRTWRT